MRHIGLLVGLLILTAAAPPAADRIHITYDEVKDATTYESDEMAPQMVERGDRQDEITLTLYSTKKGAEQKKPASSVYILLKSKSHDAIYERGWEAMRVYMLVDHKRTERGIVKFDGQTLDNGDHAEEMALWFSGPQFAELSNAKQITMEIGPAKFNVFPAQIAVMKEFARRVKLPAPAHRS